MPVGLAECIRGIIHPNGIDIFQQDGVHVARRHGPRNLRSPQDEKRHAFFFILVRLFISVRFFVFRLFLLLFHYFFDRSHSQIVAPVAVRMRDVGDMRLVFDVIGDRKAVEPIAYRFLHADVRPDAPVGENRVGVEVANQCMVSRYIGKLDDARVGGILRILCSGGGNGQQEQGEKTEKAAHMVTVAGDEMV